MRTLSAAEIATLAPGDDRPHGRLGIAETAAGLAGLLRKGDVLAAETDEVRAAALARALAAMMPAATVVVCPGTDALPGDEAPASPANVGQRVSALRTVRCTLAKRRRPRIALITTGEALARACPAPAAFDAEPPRVAAGSACDLATLAETLTELGYIADERVDEPGELALRGAVLDVFPADADAPLRIEVGDGHVVAIRSYDPADQRSTGEVEQRELGRVAEPPLGQERCTLIDHLPDATIVVSPAADDRRRRLLLLSADAAARGARRAAREVVDEAAWDKTLAARTVKTLARAGDPPPRFVEQRGPMRAFAKIAKAAVAEGRRVLLLGSARDLRFLTKRIEKAVDASATALDDWTAVAKAPAGSLLTLAAPADRGFATKGVLAVAAADLIGSRADRDDGAVRRVDPDLLQTTEVRVGDTVIHEDHGIGTVAGLETLAEDGETGGDAIKLVYARDAVRLVPVADADRLWRYGAEDDAVKLDTLDGKSWHERRVGIDAAIAETARGLTTLAAERGERTAPVLDPDPAAYERFAAGFPFSETPDQLLAIEAVRSDLSSGRPMDRLVIGDVGFGKTEVALRAAAIAALSGKQVALAAPTTVLARQHLDSFTQRFAGTDIVVAGLSRLSTAAEARRVKAGLKDGSIHIVIGTGAVTGKGVAYHDLALVIVDEEQRFGAADKAKLQALSAGHVLTLSATPIPRTLQAALVGLRQLSVIATPPARRQPIRTAVSAFAPETLRAALLRERARGGQSFVVVPRIADMAPLADQLAKLVPELELLQAHGKMPAAEIDEAMVRFGRGDGDVLLATNIIEAGLDVPRANTMAIVHADRFGLAQLHQLRGRVGRGHRRGQVLLFTDGEHDIAPRTLKRLRTLEAFDRLGAGFAISGRDLDMRGAGDLLGETQAGHMRLIGVELYQQLLEGALRTARGETVERWTPELHLGIEGRLPADWIPDEDLRLSLYARLARLRDVEDVEAFEEELRDRFGDVPDAAARLIALARVRELARAHGVARIDAGPAAVALTPRADSDIAAHVDGLEAKNGRLILAERIADPGERMERIATLLA
ncbi:DEAD/DEAH box helicase [Arthrobacter sp. TPD3018]|uniref:TRCF domain-containing protein n=1 Tax=Bacteria TaxID=2 RepID=UPI000D517645|nr:MULTISPECIES: TRCF domain-containing protein [Bacteria]PVE57985.1 DEAD/DEAH box helicase [Sphingomonas sp. TPD3009]PVE58409.1 DEAD/DEAH box helicase [Arthrobacter sp. TPD3018]PVE87834.1 DEAD/DEAH box helicase [Sphingomonas melonis]